MLPIICGGKSNHFEIVFKAFHNWTTLHLSPRLTSEFSPVTTSAGHTQMCPVGKHGYTCAHRWVLFHSLCVNSLSMPQLRLHPLLPSFVSVFTSSLHLVRRSVLPVLSQS